MGILSAHRAFSGSKPLPLTTQRAITFEPQLFLDGFYRGRRHTKYNIRFGTSGRVLRPDYAEVLEF